MIISPEGAGVFALVAQWLGVALMVAGVLIVGVRRAVVVCGNRDLPSRIELAVLLSGIALSTAGTLMTLLIA